MRRAWIAVGAVAFVTSAFAQPPTPGRLPIVPSQPLAPPAAPTSAPQAPAALQRFDTASLRLKRERTQWQLWAGNLLLKDFGPSEGDAHEALQVFRDLRVNAKGSIGGVFEYWLVDNHAPSAITRHRQIVPFDPAGLRAEKVSGQWVLRDPRVILYNFGPSRADAEQAVAVCRQYGFNQVGYVGHPVPTLKYLMVDPNPRPASTSAPVVPAAARMQALEAAHSRLVLPGAGDVGDRVPFDARRLDLRREGSEWVLYDARSPVGRFGPYERDGRAAMAALQQFRVTELCRVGDGGFGFFLANDRAPQGSAIGVGGRPINRASLNVRQTGSSWAICDGQRPIIEFGDGADDARKALAAIRHYQFDHLVPVGGGRMGQIYLLVKTRF